MTAEDARQHQPVIFRHTGPLRGSNGIHLIDRATSACNLLQEGERVKRRLALVITESVQNIFRHGETTAFVGRCELVVLSEADGYAVISGNPVGKSRATQIAKKLDAINALSREGQRSLYRRILQHGDTSKTGGAGLGFVEMAKRSEKKVSFDFQEMSGDYCFFRLKVFVSGTNRSMPD
jgi:hypothetical protein